VTRGQAGPFFGRVQKLAMTVKISTGSSLLVGQFVSLHLPSEGSGEGLVVKSVMKKEPICHKTFPNLVCEEGSIQLPASGTLSSQDCCNREKGTEFLEALDMSKNVVKFLYIYSIYIQSVE
jgi:hypothetical protein